MSEPENRTLNAILADQSPEQLQAIGQALAEAAIESQALLNEVLATAKPGAGLSANPDPFGVGGTYGRLGQSLASNPQALLNANLELWTSWISLWKDFTLGQISGVQDKRFSDPEWSSNPAFEFMRKAYELNSSWMMSLLDAAPDLSPSEKRKAQFYTRQTIDALSPTNFFATNPAALRAMLKTGGQSLVDGLRNARADIAKGGGRLSISQSDETPFEIGKNVATAPGKVVFRNKLIELLQFAPSTEQVYERPLLIFPPWINKYYIMDLREENSLIRWLVDKGLTVFVVSWRSADAVTRDFTWDDYIEHGAFAAMNEALAQTGAEKLNAIGYCIGGSLLTGALAHMAKTGDDRVSSATFFASQSDFSDAGDLMVFTDPESLDSIDTVIDENSGIMPGEMMGQTFNWLRPVDLVWRYVVDNYMMGKKPRPFDLLFWNADQTNIPGETHRTYLKNLYGKNELAEGRFKVFGEPVSMGDISIPVTIQASREDHICPWHSIYRGAQKYGGDVNFILAGSGHIAGVINHPSAEKYQHWTNEDLAKTPEAWLSGAEETKGSWWPTWWEWLEPKAGELKSAEAIEDKGLGDAPGTYVKMRLSDIAQGKMPATEYSMPSKPAARPVPKAKPAAKKASAPKPKPTTAKAKSSSTTSAKSKAGAKKPAKKTTPQGKSGRSASSPKA
ncbi:PHA/PHB synthase family protein [Henriciella marina]|uniref:Class I poly(R)-hydroxyalkanoic acid synthase n=1 Tax=Henriciella marina TaxID=453851 RepID=A0ABT4LXD7_9PROT|nr:class I poly(R)-hydroxyalkanoic acid synthase [Henriciella marina]MCZ4299036.1 class I poly(R)-hydroxyalkanoic acid synthase [Henriciella marina]